MGSVKVGRRLKTDETLSTYGSAPRLFATHKND
jgi:hypothetical protein